MSYTIKLYLFETAADPNGDDRLLAHSALPFASVEDAVAAYRRAVAHAAEIPAPSPFAALLEAGKHLQGLAPPCTAAYTKHGQPRVTCTLTRGHEALKLKHRGPEPNAVEW